MNQPTPAGDTAEALRTLASSRHVLTALADCPDAHDGTASGRAQVLANRAARPTITHAQRARCLAASAAWTAWAAVQRDPSLSAIASLGVH